MWQVCCNIYWDMEESLKTYKLHDLHTNPKYHSEHVIASLLRDKSFHIYNYLFLTMVLPLGNTVVYFQNISDKQVSATKSRFPFHFFHPAFHILYNYKEYLVLICLCVFQDSSILQELVYIPFPQQIKIRSYQLHSTVCRSAPLPQILGPGKVSIFK